MTKLIGYIGNRIGAKNNHQQLEALNASGCETVFEEDTSTSKMATQLDRAIEFMQQGDILVGYSLNDIARSLGDLRELVDKIRSRGCGLKILMPQIEATAHCDDVAFGIIVAIVDFQRGVVRERTRVGLRSARLQGRLGGNPLIIDRDPDTILRLKESKRADYLSSLQKSESVWQSTVIRVRVEGGTWSEALRSINANLASDKHWTLPRLKRAVATYVAEGWIDSSVLEGTAPSQKPDLIAKVVASIIHTKQKLTLRQIGDELERLGHKPPRGTTWAPSSVRHQIDIATKLGLIIQGEGW